jgi:hypothetical protein
MFKHETLKCNHKTAEEAEQHAEKIKAASPGVDVWVEDTVTLFKVETWKND